MADRDTERAEGQKVTKRDSEDSVRFYEILRNSEKV
jgi:hypothetical protein